MKRERWSGKVLRGLEMALDAAGGHGGWTPRQRADLEAASRWAATKRADMEERRAERADREARAALARLEELL